MLCVTPGMIVPCDGLLIKGMGVLTDESAITGETEQLRKESFEKCVTEEESASPFIMAGTTFCTGEGLYLALQVGSRTSAGKIHELSQPSQNEEITPLQEKLEVIATTIGKIGLFFAVMTVTVLMIRFVIQKKTDGDWDWKN